MIRGSTASRRRQRAARQSVVQALEPRLLLCADDGFSDPVPGMLPATGTAIIQPAASTGTLYPLTAVPALNSDPGAPATLYLDFHGEAGQTWGFQDVPATPAYDIDGDPTTFSAQELTNIQQIWAAVAEAYSPFNVNVTTVDPGTWSTGGQHQFRDVIGGNGSWTGVAEGGTAYVRSYSDSSLPDTAYVFSTNLGNDPTYTAIDAVHEAGHGFGLQHQSLYSGTAKTSEYNPGNGVIAPFMGNALSGARATWWDGQSSLGYNVIEDDLAVLSGSRDGFGYKAQDHGQSPGAATPLTVSGTSLSGSGVVETTADQDYFSFTTAAGTCTFDVNVAQYGPMLHAILELHDANNNVIAVANNAGTLSQTITATLAAGNYYLVVKSYGQYGDIGQYTLSGTIAAGQVTPTFAIAGAASVNEGSPYTLSLSAADPGHSITSWSINWGDGNVQAVSGNPSSVSHTYAVGPHSYSISATATDNTNTTYNAGNVQPVSVLHVPPTLSLSGAPSVNEGSLYTLSLSASDPGHVIQGWSINWGDGSAVQAVIGNASSVTHTYAVGPHTWVIGAVATDDVGTYSAGNSVAVTVNDVPPTIALGGASGVNEGSTYTLTLGTITDPGADTVSSYIVHWGDGTSQTFATNVGKPHVFGDAGADNIVVDVVDENGTHTNCGNLSITVNDVPPIVIIGGPALVSVGGTYVLSLAVGEPSADVVGSWSINWGDGSPVQAVSGSPSSVAHLFAAAGSYTITASVNDSDGVWNANPQAVTVNAQPVFTIAGEPSVNERAAYTLSLSPSDPGRTVTGWTINWGDGSAVQAVSGSPSSVTHTYALGPHNYAITASATDDTGGSYVANSMAVSVMHVPPMVNIWDAGTATSPYTLGLSESDPGHAIQGWAINWGDGSPVQSVTGNPASVTHPYAPGNYAISATLTDDLGTYASNVLPVAVVAPDPPPEPATSLGPLAPKGRTALGGMLSVPGAETLYALTMTQPEIVTVRLSGHRDLLRLDLLDANHNVILSRTGKHGQALTATLTPGAWYIRVTFVGKKASRYQLAATAKPLPHRKNRLRPATTVATVS